MLSTGSAAAQGSGVARPYRGLFGPDERAAAKVLSVSGAAGVGYETQVLVEQRNPGVTFGNTSFLRADDTYSLFAAAITYSDYTDRRDLNASFSSVARNYTQFATVASHQGSVGFNWRVGRRTTLIGFGNAMYQPWGAVTFLPTATDLNVVGQTIAPLREVPVLNGAYTSYSSRGAIAQQLSRRSTVTGSYGYDLVSVSGLIGDFRRQEASIRYDHGLTRNLGWHAGYIYSEARFLGEQKRYRGRSIDAGVDYTRSLSLSRRTRFGFTTGAMAIDDTSQLTPLGYGKTRYVATGGAWLTRQIGRTWDAVVSYSHNVAFVEALRVPYFYDGINMGISGLISRRLLFRSVVGATIGEASILTETGGSNQFSTVAATTGLIFAFTRNVAIAADYAAYAYSFDDGVAPFWRGVTPDMTRQGVLISLRAWVPVIERGRRSNASR